MKIETEAFRAALDLAGRAAEKTTPLDILRFARFTAKGGQFTVACNDMTMYAEARGECEAGDMAFCVRADRLSAALVTAGKTIDLSLKSQTLTWKSGNARYQMPTLPVADFPTPKRDGKPLVTLEGDIAAGLKRVVFSAAVKDLRYYLVGVLIECAKNGEVSLVATDGAKMAALKLDASVATEAQAIVHRDAVNSLPEGAMRARLYEQRVEFDYPNGLIVTQCIDARFPEWRRVFPSGKPAATLKVDRKALAHAIKAALPFDELGGVHLVLADGVFRIEAADKGGDRAELSIDGEGNGEADLWFVSGVLSPAINAAEGDSLSLQFAGPGMAVTFEDGPLRCICMPARR